MLLLPSTEQKVFVSRHTTFLKNELIQEGSSGRNIELMEGQDLQTIQKYLWLNYKKILNQKYPRMRYIHNTHLLSEGQIECIKHL